jgi:hypothetical protein
MVKRLDDLFRLSRGSTEELVETPQRELVPYKFYRYQKIWDSMREEWLSKPVSMYLPGSSDSACIYGDAYEVIPFAHSSRYCIRYNKKVIISFGNLRQANEFYCALGQRFTPIAKLVYNEIAFDIYYGNYRESSRYLIDEIPYFTPIFPTIICDFLISFVWDPYDIYMGLGMME